MSSMRNLMAVALGTVLVSVCLAQGGASAGKRSAAHEAFTALLQKHVKDGVVSYKGFQADEVALDEYLSYFARTDPKTLSPIAQKAFWINAYNAYTIKLILKKYPDLKSIKDFWGPWDKKDWLVNGKKVTLNHMEHKVLRKMGDARIHVAINCASFSCPDLRDEAFVPERLDAQLDDAMKTFFANQEKGFKAATEPGKVYGTNHNVYLSKILSWFGGDFGSNQAERLAYIKPYLPAEGQAFLDAHVGEISVNFMSYNWSLNGE